MFLLIAFVLIFYLVISYLIAQEFCEIALKKGYDDKKYFWYSFLFGIIGYLMVVALPTKIMLQNDANTNNQSSEKDSYINYIQKESGTKQCPNCGVYHISESKVCPSCKYKYND